MCGYDMTKIEALEAMKKGEKVTREYFSDYEYVYIDSHGIMRFEDDMTTAEWWNVIEPSIWKTSDKCWSIWRDCNGQ